MLPLIHSFEEYETFKVKIDALEAAAKQIIHIHQSIEFPLKLCSEGTNIVFEHGEIAYTAMLRLIFLENQH